MVNVPFIEYPRIAKRIESHWNPDGNPHQSFLGTTGSGKSYLIRHGILPIAGPSRTVVIDVKSGGSHTWKGYGNEVTELSPLFGIGPDGTAHYHLISRNRETVRRFLDMILIEGSCIVVLDDSRQITENSPNWGLRANVDNLMTLGREIGITVLICANSTIWAASGLKDQCGINWIGRISNEKQCIEALKNAGLPVKELLSITAKLGNHEFLYSDHFDGEARIALTRFNPESLCHGAGIHAVTDH